MARTKKTKTVRGAASLGLRRRLSLYYSRTILVVKLSIIVVIASFIFTNAFSGIKNSARELVYNQTARAGFVLENIVIQGQINTPSKDIIEAIGANKGKPIFSLSISDIKNSLENNPWVKSCIIERRLPNTLYVAIFERKPLAIWQFNKKLYLIDENGERISSDNIESFPDLLQVVGDGANLYASSLIAELSTYPPIAKKVKAATRFGNRRWDIILEGGISVKMPENNFDKAYKYLQKLDKEQKLFDNNFKSFDLRLSDRYFFEKY